MGKRRTDLPHRTRYDDDDDDDDVIEEIPAPEPTEEQRASIQGRKKLVAKRRVNESNAGQSSIFSGAASIMTSSDDTSKPSIFSGFKGFGGFSAAPPASTSSSVSIEKAAPTPSLFNSNPEPFKSTNPPLTTTTNTPISFSFLENKPPVLSSSSSSSSTNGATTLKESNGTNTNTELNTGAKATQDAKTTNSGKNLTEAELKFIYGLNELYESCYGHGDRSYKLPDSVINGDSGSGNDEASKYAYMLSALNKHCAKWISKHVEESPLVILTPVFIDYFNYLIQLEKKFFPETFKNPNNKPATQLSSTMNGHSEKENKEVVKQAPFPAQLTPISIFSGSSTLTAPAAAPTLPSTTTTLNLTPSVAPTLTFGSGAKPPSTSSFSFTPLTTLKDTSAEKTQEEPVKKNESEKPMISLPVTKTTPVISFDKTETPVAAKPNPFTDLTTASKPIFQFGSGASNSSSNNTASSTLTPFGSFSTPKPAEESSTSEKTLTATPAALTTPFNFFGNLNKDKPVSETSTEKPAQTPVPAATSTPFFSFGNQANKPSIFSGIGAGGDAAAKPATSIFGSLGSTSSPFGAASTGGLLFGASTTPAPFGATTGSGETGEDGEEEAYEPPKPEASDVKEEGSVLTKRIKLFYFNEKEKKFTDRGIGNLFIKPTNDGESTQLIVRADNKLANILLNVKLSKSLPVSKAGAKDVSYLCLPNPPIPNVESNVPCKFLFRVKTEEDAQELLDKLNEYKK